MSGIQTFTVSHCALFRFSLSNKKWKIAFPTKIIFTPCKVLPEYAKAEIDQDSGFTCRHFYGISASKRQKSLSFCDNIRPTGITPWTRFQW